MSENDEELTRFYPSALHAGWPPGQLINATPPLHPARRVQADVIIRDFLPQRVLRVTTIGVDAYGLRVRYEVTPPVPALNARPPGATEEDGVLYEWYLAGRDDRGHHYDTGGGAYGLAADGQRTEGEHTLTPVPAADASWLDIAFCIGDAGEHLEHARYVLRVQFPLLIERPGDGV